MHSVRNTAGGCDYLSNFTIYYSRGTALLLFLSFLKWIKLVIKFWISVLEIKVVEGSQSGADCRGENLLQVPMLSAAIEECRCAHIPIPIHAPEIQVSPIDEFIALPVGHQVLEEAKIN